MTLTERIIATCTQDLPARIPPEATAAARQCLVDSLAVAYAACGEEPIAMLRATSTQGSRQGESTVIGSGERARAADAALVNGTMISLQLFDDNHGPMRGHPSAPLLPAVLAAAEVADASLAGALTAFTVGFEFECQLGVLLNPSHYEHGWHATATQGTMAAALSAGMLLKLDAGQMAHALGIAASMAGGMRRNFGSMTMSLHSGHAASSGVRAAQLAKLGYTASTAIFDEPRGYGEMFSRDWTAQAALDSLPRWGRPWMIVSPGPIFKLFPCGRPTLYGVDAAMEIQRVHGIAAQDVRRIVCEVSYMFPRTLIHSRPTNGLQGKTSIEYCMATALVDGRPSLASFTDEAVRRPLVRQLIERTEIRVPPELSEDVPAVRKAPFEQPVTVTIETNDGRTLKATVADHKGTPRNPASDAELRSKFADCAGMHMDPSRVQAILDAIDDGRGTVRTLAALLETTR